MGKQLFENVKREQIFWLDPDDLTVVGIDTDDGIEHDLVNHRVEFLKRNGVSQQMVDSIKVDGVLQPIVVRKNGERTEVMLGRNRTLSAREANKQAGYERDHEERIHVPCLNRKNNESHSVLGIVETENNVRLDDDAMTRAKNARRLLDRGMTEKAVSIKMGTTVVGLQNLLKVLELSPVMQKAVEEREVPWSAAITFVDLSHEDQAAKLEEARTRGITISTPEARRMRKARGVAKKNGKAKADGQSMRGKGVAVGTLRKLAEDEWFDGLDSQMKHLFKWAIGEGSHRSVKGLPDALRRIGEIE